MRYPSTRYLVLSVLVAGAGLGLAQVPVGRPFQSPEPPYADDVDTASVKAQVGAKDNGIEQASRRAPASADGPRSLPSTVTDPSGVVPVQYTRVATPASEIPTPVVTLNIEGNNVSPSGQPVIYKISVRNTSRAKAHNVIVRVIQPKNAERIKWEPTATEDAAIARWEFKTLEPGQERTIEISYRPKTDTEEVKIQARVGFDFGRGMITKVSAPSLSIKKEGPEKLVIGDIVTYRITVTNNGHVTIHDIDVKDMLNHGLAHEDREISRGMVDGRLVSNIDPKNGERTWSIPVLAPGESKVIEYRVRVREQGRIGSTVKAIASNVTKEAGLDVTVLTARLQVHADGPGGDKGTVGQSAIYRVTVDNRGTADLKNVVVKCLYPPDMHPTKATNGGRPFRDRVQWIFRELKAGESKELNIGLRTSTPGTRTVQFSAKADKGPEQTASTKTTFAGVPTIDWDTDVPGTVSVGKTMTYRVTVSNGGTAAAKRIQVRVDLPDNVDLVDTVPPSGKGIGQNAKQVIFPEYDIPAGKKTTLRIRVKGARPAKRASGFN